MENLDFSKISLDGVGSTSFKNPNESDFIERTDLAEMWVHNNNNNGNFTKHKIK